MAIDPQQPIPLYFQLKTLLLEEILSGHYGGADDRLPTEHELCERYKLSRTPVSRALSELADEGVILRHRRRGSFVNPHWLSRRPDHPEIRVIVPTEGPWARMIRDAAGDRNQISVVKVPRQSLHQTLTHAVAEGQAPDLAVIDSVWAPEFAAAGFIHALEELNEGWVREEHEVDFLEPLVRANRYEGKTFGVSPFADASGLWYSRRKLESLGLDAADDLDRAANGRTALAAGGLRDPMVMPGGGMAGETTAYCLIAVLASNAAHVLGRGREPRLPSYRPGASLPAQPRRGGHRPLGSGRVRLGPRGSAPGRRTRRAQPRRVYEAQTLAEALGVHHHEVWDHFGFTCVPAGPKGSPASVAGGMMFAIFRQAAQPRLAMQLSSGASSPKPSLGSHAQPGESRLGARRSSSWPPTFPSSPRSPRSSSWPWRGHGCRRIRGSRCSCRRCSRRSSPAGSARRPRRSAPRR